MTDEEELTGDDAAPPRAEKTPRSETSSPSSANTLPEVTWPDDAVDSESVGDDGTASGTSSLEADEPPRQRDAHIRCAADAPAEWHRLIELVPPPHQYSTLGAHFPSSCDCSAPPPLLRTLSMSCQETGQHAMVTTVAARFLSHGLALTRHVPWNIVCSGYSSSPALLTMPPTLLLFAESNDLTQLAHGAVSQRRPGGDRATAALTLSGLRFPCASPLRAHRLDLRRSPITCAHNKKPPSQPPAAVCAS